MVDALRAKRALLAGAVVVVTATCLLIPLAPRFWPVAAAEVIGGLAGTTIGPCLAAISLGIVGPARFARRAGRNESLFHLGNGAINLMILATAPVAGTSIVFWMMGLTAAASVGAAWAVPERAIDHDAARGLSPDGARHGLQPSPWSTLLASRPSLVFAACGALFHLANAAMLGLVAQKLAVEHPGQGIAFTAACAIVAQSVMVPTAALAGRRADAWGRKPLLLAAVVALVLRGMLYTLSDHPAWLIGVQLLDGVGAGLIGALFPVVVADLTRGSGHFNAAGGAVGTVHAVGGLLSGALAGQIVVLAGYQAAFLTLAAVAALGCRALQAALGQAVALLTPRLLRSAGGVLHQAVHLRPCGGPGHPAQALVRACEPGLLWPCEQALNGRYYVVCTGRDLDQAVASPTVHDVGHRRGYHGHAGRKELGRLGRADVSHGLVQREGHQAHIPSGKMAQQRRIGLLAQPVQVAALRQGGGVKLGNRARTYERSLSQRPPRQARSALSQAASGCRSGTQASPVFASDDTASGVTTTSRSAGRLASARSMAGLS